MPSIPDGAEVIELYDDDDENDSMDSQPMGRQDGDSDSACEDRNEAFRHIVEDIDILWEDQNDEQENLRIDALTESVRTKLDNIQLKRSWIRALNAHGIVDINTRGDQDIMEPIMGSPPFQEKRSDKKVVYSPAGKHFQDSANDMLLAAKVFIHATEKEQIHPLRYDWEFQLLHTLDLTYLDDGDNLPTVQERAFAMLATIIVSSAANDRSAINGIKKLHEKGLLSPKGLMDADVKDIAKCIFSIGIQDNKAAYLKSAATRIMEHYNGLVPETVEQLMTLDGVYTKTARLIVAEAFGLCCGVACDAHVINFTNALRMIRERNNGVNHIDYALRQIIPGNYFRWINMVMGSFGQLFTQMIPLGYDLDLFSPVLDFETTVIEDHITVVDIVRRVKKILVSHFREPREQEMICFIIQRLRVYYRTKNSPEIVGPVIQEGFLI